MKNEDYYEIDMFNTRMDCTFSPPSSFASSLAAVWPPAATSPPAEPYDVLIVSFEKTKKTSPL